jgi:hypothetical protein
MPILQNKGDEGSNTSSSVSPARSSVLGKAWGQTKWLAGGGGRFEPFRSKKSLKVGV